MCVVDCDRVGPVCQTAYYLRFTILCLLAYVVLNASEDYDFFIAFTISDKGHRGVVNAL